MPLVAQGKTNWKFLLIVAVLAALTGGGILYYCSIANPPDNFNTFTEKKITVEEKIKKLLPKDVYLRELELIPNTSSDSYLVIYIEDPKLDEVPKETAGLYLSCPESTVGQAMVGIYHLALFQKNSIINDVVIPSGSTVYADPQTAGVPLPPKQRLVWRNTKFNINTMFGGPEPSKEEEFELEKVKLINFQDYNGDGQKYEFKLTGETAPCGHTHYLIAGYDAKNNKAIVYPIIKKEKTFYWHDNFLPDSSGRVEWRFQCGDHGNDTEEYELYQFNSESKAYMLLEDKKTFCSGDDWKTYKNDKYGFEIKYPQELKISSEGPNSAAQVLDSGSGTVTPSYDTISFSDDLNELVRIEIFHKYGGDIIEENYKDKDYLYLSGPCDIRWGFVPKSISLKFINDIKMLEVRGGEKTTTCYYLKNLDGNLIIISNKGYKVDIFNQIFSTFRFIQINNGITN